MTQSIIKYSPEDLKRIGHGLVKQSKAGMKRAGQLLAKSAKDAADRDFATRVTSRVEELIKHRNNLYIALDKTKKEIKLYDDRIAAIESGEFTVGYDGAVLFNDEKLRVGGWQ